MKKIVITFTECEHDGDLENYKSDVTASGGNIISASCDDSEEGIMEVEIPDDFIEKFRQTDSFDFSSLAD